MFVFNGKHGQELLFKRIFFFNFFLVTPTAFVSTPQIPESPPCQVSLKPVSFSHYTQSLWIGFLQTYFFNIVTKFCLFPIGLVFVARGNQVGGMLLLLLVLVLVP